MVVTVNIPDELAAAAKARGLSLEAYVQEILAQQLAHPAEPRQPRTPEEIRAWLDSLAQFSDKIPPLPETISREWRKIVVERSVLGVQVHDARLAAAMYVHRVSHILTLNVTDFGRFGGLTVLHPNRI